jgi:hypothetical protein
MITWENVVVPWEANHPQTSEPTGENISENTEAKGGVEDG